MIIILDKISREKSINIQCILYMFTKYHLEMTFQHNIIINIYNGLNKFDKLVYIQLLFRNRMTCMTFSTRVQIKSVEKQKLIFWNTHYFSYT